MRIRDKKTGSVGKQDRLVLKILSVFFLESALLGIFLFRLPEAPMELKEQIKNYIIGFAPIFLFIFIAPLEIYIEKYYRTMYPSRGGPFSFFVGFGFALLIQGILAIIISALMLFGKAILRVDFSWDEINYFKDWGFNFFLGGFGLSLSAIQLASREDKSQSQEPNEPRGQGR